MRQLSAKNKRLSFLISFLILILGQNCFALPPDQIYDQVKDSIVVIKTYNKIGELVSLGSGVMLPSGKFVTNYHVVKKGAQYSVGQGNNFVPAILELMDQEKDICILSAPGLNSKPAILGKSIRLKVGERVYAIGAPQGLELSLSEGIVSQLRGNPPPIIQTTAAISPGSSGGGLFNVECELVGITTIQLKESQNLNFALPVEWITQVMVKAKDILPPTKIPEPQPIISEPIPEGDSHQNAKTLFEEGRSLFKQGKFSETIDKLQKSIHLNPNQSSAHYILGWAYNQFDRNQEAIESFKKAISLKNDYALAYDGLCWTYNKIGRYRDAIEVGRVATKLKFNFPDAQYNLGMAYLGIGNKEMAIKQYNILEKIDIEKANLLLTNIGNTSQISQGRSLNKNIHKNIWFAVIASFSNIDNAKRYIENLKSLSIPHEIELYFSDTGYYEVTLGGYLDLKEASRRASFAKAQGISPEAYARKSDKWGDNLLKN